MRKTVCAFAAAAALALPSANLVAAARAATPAKKKVVTVTKSISGTLTSVDRWGDLQVVVKVKKTTTTVGKKKTVTRKIIAVQVPVYPDHTDRSVYINQQALPLLIQEELQAQLGGQIQMISGATDTSESFAQSLQAALVAAQKA
jgi:uncharacterized protein with FMN-binding domain